MASNNSTSSRGVIAVCGATGRQGGAVVNKLLQDGWQVRALTRHPEGELARALARQGAVPVGADLREPASLDKALVGADGVFGVTNFWEHGFRGELSMGTNLIESAKRSGVTHFVFSSVGATERTVGLGIEHFEAKAEIEARLQASGLDWTIFRPVTFMENLVTPGFRKAICERGVLRFGFNKKHVFQMVAMKDIAAFVALAFDGDARLKGHATEIASDAFTMQQLVDTIGEEVGRSVRYKVISPVQLHIFSAFIRATGRQSFYKAGPSLINQFRWNNDSPIGGWDADIDRLRSIHPGLLSLKEWTQSIAWREGLN